MGKTVLKNACWTVEVLHEGRLMGRMNKFTLLRAGMIAMRGYLMDGTTLGLLLTKTIAAILLRLLEVIPKPLKNAVYSTENTKNKGFGIGSK